jgi:CelD/BcsL family acetyltransferase involved in cellulose biosynthesis
MARPVDLRRVTRPGAVENVSVGSVADFATLERKWRDLEVRSNPSFFQSWTWTGCLVEERFPDPVLVEASENGRTVALALFNRRGRTLFLGQTGDPVLDCIYIEFNGVLAESGREAGLTVACLRAARDGCAGWPALAFSRKHRLILSGISGATATSAAKAGHVRYNKSLAAPSVDLTDLSRCFLDRRSANTRQQLRRSDRSYAATEGIVIERAETLAQAYEFLEKMAELHRVSWVAKGQQGSFANPFFGRFHRALVARGHERGEIDLLRIAAGPRTIGYLYNFRYLGHSLAYQSGFDYAGAEKHEKPGQTCHHAAIRFALSWGAAQYNFLAGDARYKRSLSDRAEVLHWVEITHLHYLRSLITRTRNVVAKGRCLLVH